MWNIFKLNILKASTSYQYKNSTSNFASYFASEYENALRRGGDTLNGVPILRGNKALFISIFNAGLIKGQNTISESFNILSELSKAIKAYWTGATLAPNPNPTINPIGWPATIPAPGSVLNIGPGLIPNTVTHPGTPNPNPRKILPTTTFTQGGTVFCDPFVTMAKLHLTTVSGIINTTSMYPTPPTPTPLPGVIFWTGYTVLNQSKPSAAKSTTSEVNEIPADKQAEALELQNEAIKSDVATAQSILDESGGGGSGGGGGISESTREMARSFIADSQNRSSVGEAFTTNNEIKEDEKNQLNESVDANTPPDSTSNRKYSKNKNLDLIEKALAKVGITDVAIVRAVKANVMKESGGQPIGENLNYGGTSNDRIRSIFGSRATKYNDAQLNEIKKDKKKMAEMMYGPGAGQVAVWLGNNQTGDGWKFRGRGFIQVTGRANYTANSLAVYKSNALVNNPDLLLQPEDAADSTAWFINRSLASFSRKMGIPTKGATQAQANLLITSIIAGQVIKRGTGSYLSGLVDKVDVYSKQV